jgi:hypothetical protein
LDWRTEWPWSSEEEAEWKAELEERNDDLLEELMGGVVEEGIAGSRYGIGATQQEEPAEDTMPEKYSVTA